MASKVDPGSIKALVFDVFGTVVDWRGSIIAEGESDWRARGIDIDWAAFAEQWRAGYAPAMDRVRTGELPWTNLYALHRMRLDELLSSFGISGLDDAVKDRLNKIWHRLQGWPDSSPGLARLKTGFVIAPLSNGNFALLTEMGKFSNLPWDCVLSTEIFRHYKPDPETYLGACALLGLEPHEVMMCAAHVTDLEAAAKLGLRTAYIHRPLEWGRERPVSRPDTSAFDIVVDSIEELATALGV